MQNTRVAMLDFGAWVEEAMLRDMVYVGGIQRARMMVSRMRAVP